MSEKANVGLVGLGLVGTALAKRLLGAGLKVTGFDIDAARREAFAVLGGTAVATVGEVARICPRVISAVFNTEQLADVIEGKEGVIDAVAGASRTILNVTTSDPDKVAALAVRIAPQGVTLLEVPISGTSEQIVQGDGVGLIGGERAAFEACGDILDAICPKRYFTGAVGNGAKTKLAVNLILGLNRAALAEGLVFAERLGLDPRAFLEVARGSAAYSQIMDVKGEKYVNRDYHPHGKIVQHLKDVHMMVDYAHRAGQALPLMEVVQNLLEGNVKHGEGDFDNCAVIEEVRRRTC
ncbi:MAG: NAD(P)-dependent oxidoreductase [Betaproteobacteria bacterium]|nr:NAD(P)-dependent oxidoreductase [Betaproteobacteria bacterium]